MDRSETVGEWLDRWYAGKRAARESTARGYRQHLDHYLIPQLGRAPLDRLNAEHIADLFDLIDEWNAEVVAAREKSRRPLLEGDTRRRAKVVGPATQRRIFATLRNALNAAVKQRRIAYNPCAGVEMPEEHRTEARVWSPAQVGAFLAAAEDDRLELLYRLVLLRGLRRGEACGLRWADLDLDAKELRVTRPILQLGAGWSTVGRRRRPASARCRWTLTAPPKLHEGRHTAATLALEAGLDIKVVSDQLGHSTTRITQDLYQHVRRAVHGDAAEKVVALLPERKAREVRS